MFNVLKKLASSRTEDELPNRLPNHISMPTNLQRKFARGVQYNMKVIIKGDRCSGKTSLFRRLQGKPLDDEYRPTEQIQVAHVQWNYKNGDEIVKVEVWDVVDKGKAVTVDAVTAALDAEFVDVYKGAHGVILVMDVTKDWTFAYARNEIPKVPRNVPVLILGNRCDMGHHHKIPEDSVRQFIEGIQRPKNVAQVRYSETSMVNGFGLKYVYKFFALPFLHLQRSVLESQLSRNLEEIETALREIDLFQTSQASDYDAFSNHLALKRRQKADELGVGLISGNPPTSRTPSVIFGLGHPINRHNPFRRSPDMPKIDFKCRTATKGTDSEGVSTLEEFVPDEQFDDKFFLDSPLPEMQPPRSSQNDSETDEEANPLVTNIQEDVNPEDEIEMNFPEFLFCPKNNHNGKSTSNAAEVDTKVERSTPLKLKRNQTLDLKGSGEPRQKHSDEKPSTDSKSQKKHKKLKERSATSKKKMKNQELKE